MKIFLKANGLILASSVILECWSRGLSNLHKKTGAVEASTQNLLNLQKPINAVKDSAAQRSVLSVNVFSANSKMTQNGYDVEHSHRNKTPAVLKSNDTTIAQVGRRLDVQYIKTPKAQHLSDMHPNTTGMLLGHLPVPGKLDTKVDIYCYPPHQDEYVSGSILHSGAWENEFVARCADPWLANPNLKGNFLDVGGNIGAYTLPLARFLQGKGEVISVEGMPDIAEHLKAGIVANKLSNVNLFGYCVGSPDAADYLTMNRNPFNKGGSTIDGNKHATGTANGKKVRVGLTTLDSMLEALPALKSVVAMKSDIEGNEGRMLKGAHDFFTKYPPCYLLFELHPAWLETAGTPYAEVIKMLTNFGYDPPRHFGGFDYMFQQKDVPSCLKRFG